MGSGSTINMSLVARVGVFAALALGINTPFLAVPNFELFSFSIFLSGLFLGAAGGSATAFIAGIIFVLFNPNGAQPILLVGIAQIFGFIIFGLSGGLLRPIVLKPVNRKKLVVILFMIGAILTFWYDLSTNVAFAVIFGPFWPALMGGLAFSLLHIISNSLIFGLSGAIIQKIWKRIEYIMPPLAAS